MRKPLFVAVLLLSLVAGPILAQLPPECGTTLPLASPYVFILFDISGSQNHAADCTQAEYDAGQCNVDECPSFDPCADVSSLRSQANVKTSVIAVGMPYNSQINCMVQNGHGEQFYPRTRQQIEDSLTDFFTNVAGVQP